MLKTDLSAVPPTTRSTEQNQPAYHKSFIDLFKKNMRRKNRSALNRLSAANLSCWSSKEEKGVFAKSHWQRDRLIPPPPALP
jgi:hypothetical protein